MWLSVAHKSMATPANVASNYISASGILARPMNKAYNFLTLRRIKARGKCPDMGARPDSVEESTKPNFMSRQLRIWIVLRSISGLFI